MKEELIKVIESSKNGDEKSFEFLYLRYKNYIKKLSFNNYIQGSDYEDTIQHGYIGLWKGINQFKKEKVINIDAFFVMCIKREIYTAIKKADRKKHSIMNNSRSFEDIVFQSKSTKDLKLIDVYIGDAKSAEEEALFNIDKITFNKRINAAFSSLSDMERKCIRLYIYGYKPREICSFLNLTPKQTDNALTRAKKTLKKKYNSRDYLKAK